MSAPALQSSDETNLLFYALLRHDFISFVEFTFDVVRPGVIFRPNWHIEAVAHKLAQVAEGKVKRLIITLPPRSLKSLMASVAYRLGSSDTHRPSEW